MAKANVADFTGKSLGNLAYEKVSQGSMSDASSPKKGDGVDGENLKITPANLSDVPIDGVSCPKEKGANGNTVDSSIWAKADVRELYNDKGK